MATNDFKEMVSGSGAKQFWARPVADQVKAFSERAPTFAALPPEQQAVILNGLKEQAIARGVADPVVTAPPPGAETPMDKAMAPAKSAWQIATTPTSELIFGPGVSASGAYKNLVQVEPDDSSVTKFAKGAGAGVAELVDSMQSPVGLVSLAAGPAGALARGAIARAAATQVGERVAGNIFLQAAGKAVAPKVASVAGKGIKAAKVGLSLQVGQHLYSSLGEAIESGDPEKIGKALSEVASVAAAVGGPKASKWVKDVKAKAAAPPASEEIVRRAMGEGMAGQPQLPITPKPTAQAASGGNPDIAAAADEIITRPLRASSSAPMLPAAPTVRETTETYARLSGHPEHEVRRLAALDVDELMSRKSLLESRRGSEISPIEASQPRPEPGSARSRGTVRELEERELDAIKMLLQDKGVDLTASHLRAPSQTGVPPTTGAPMATTEGARDISEVILGREVQPTAGVAKNTLGQTEVPPAVGSPGRPLLPPSVDPLAGDEQMMRIGQTFGVGQDIMKQLVSSSNEQLVRFSNMLTARRTQAALASRNNKVDVVGPGQAGADLGSYDSAIGAVQAILMERQAASRIPPSRRGR